MGIKRISPGVFYLDIRVQKDGDIFRKRETFQGGKKSAENRVFEIQNELRAQANAEPSSLKSSSQIETFGDVLDWYYEAKKDHLVSRHSRK
jgi:hypothetical protein